MIKYKIKEILSGIFLAEFEDKYDLAMTFLRYQEFYESANPKFKGKHFALLDYIEWYSKQNKNIFTYPDDWAGFNIPASVIYEVNSNSTGRGAIPDRNKYDDLMRKIANECRAKSVSNTKFYILGAYKGDVYTLRHEVAHGLYSVYSSYKKAMDIAYSELTEKNKKKLQTSFEKMGYHKSVWKDEAQAYLATGADYLSAAERKSFVKIFKESTKNINWKNK